MTPAVIASLNDALRARELVKVKLQRGADARPKDAANALALATSAEVIQVIGRTTTLYRENPELRKTDKDVPPWRTW
jgi:RNA-binding protein